MDGVELARRMLAKIDSELQSMDAAIVAGGLPDHGAYRYTTGRRQGIVAVRAMLVDQLGPRGREDLTLGV